MKDLDAARVRTWVGLATTSLAAVRDDLDRSNVFPVADADTGTNLALTLAEGRRAVERVGRSASDTDVLVALATGCRRGARGNSGTLLAEWVRALGRAWGTRGAAGALDAAARAVHESVGAPVEGTFLTIARVAADAADAAARAARAADAAADAAHAGGAPEDVLAAACRAARAELPRTPDLLPALRGRVDAGAHGLVVVLEALAAAFGVDVPDPAEPVSGAGGRIVPVDANSAGTAGSAAALAPGLLAPGLTSDQGAHEVVLGVDAPGRSLGVPLRDALGAVGDSVAVAGGDGVWHLHVHTDDPAAAVAAVDAVVGEQGESYDVQVRFLGAHAHRGPHVLVDPHGVPDEAATDAGAPRGPVVVVVTSAPGLLAPLARSGAIALLADAAHVAGDDAVLRATQDAGSAGAPVTVLGPSESDLRLVAALATLDTVDPQAPTSDRLVALRGAHDGLRVVRVQPGVLDVAAASGPAEPAEPTGHLADVSALGPEDVVLLLHGEDADPGALADLVAAVGRGGAGPEVVVLASGRPDAGVELGWEPAGSAR